MNNSDQYLKYIKIRSALKLSTKLEDRLSFMEHSIRNKSKNINIISNCMNSKKSKKYQLNEEFMNTFENMSLEEKQNYYISALEYLDLRINKNLIPENQIQYQNHNINCSLEQSAFKYLTKVSITIFRKECKIQLKMNQVRQHIKLKNYLVRKSKDQRGRCFILQSIVANVKQKYKFQCFSQVDYSICLTQLIAIMCSIQIKEIQEDLKVTQQKKKKQERSKQDITISNMDQRIQIIGSSQQVSNKKAFLLNFLNQRQSENIIEQIQKQNQIIKQHLYNESNKKNNQEYIKIQKKTHETYFKYLFPNYDLPSLTLIQNNFQQIYNSQDSDNKIYKKKQQKDTKTYKIVFFTKNKIKNFVSNLLDINNYRSWSSKFDIGNVKIRITSENTLIIYQKYKKINQLTDDYVYLRHLFNINNILYIVDKSIINPNFPKFSNIKRIQIKYRIWAFQQINDNIAKISIQSNVQIQNCKDWIMRQYQKLEQLQKYLQTKNSSQKIFSALLLDLYWGIKKQNHFNYVKQEDNSNLFSQNLCSEIRQQTIFYTIKQLSQYVSGLSSRSNYNANNKNNKASVERLDQIQQIFEEYTMTHRINHSQQINQNHQKIAIANDYLNKNYIVAPLKNRKNKKQQSNYQYHHIWKNVWQVSQQGVVICQNQQMLKKQHQIFTDLKRFYKNLTKNNNIFNIPLPNQVLNQKTILQYVAGSLKLAPHFLQKAEILDSSLQRFKYAIAFGLSQCLLSLQMEKPFNANIGQTFQAWINGCPIYCEQVSARPQISRFFFQGRGYRIYGSMQTVVEMNINSALGINEGDTIIEFEKYPTQKIHIRLPKGQVSGVLFGNRQFSLIDKAYFYDQQNNYYGIIQFNNKSKSAKNHADFITGNIFQVDKKFISKLNQCKFHEQFNKLQPPQKISLCEISGRWTQSLHFNKVSYYNVDVDIPYCLVKQKFPLISDSQYRDDVYYRKIKDYVKSQIQKQRIQTIQRKDQMLRIKRQYKLE